MVDQNYLDDLSAKLSAAPCPDCGETHSVTLKLFQASSNGRPVVTFDFPDQATCPGFKQKATAFASLLINEKNVGPCPFDLI